MVEEQIRFLDNKISSHLIFILKILLLAHIIFVYTFMLFNNVFNVGRINTSYMQH